MQDREEDRSATAETGLVTLQVQLRPEHLRQLRGLAAREGATPEAFAALLIEEKLAEAAGGSGSAG